MRAGEMTKSKSSKAGKHPGASPIKPPIRKSPNAKSNTILRCERYAHGCPNTNSSNRLSRLHPGPGGPNTLCPACHKKYNKGILPSFAAGIFGAPGLPPHSVHRKVHPVIPTVRAGAPHGDSSLRKPSDLPGTGKPPASEVRRSPRFETATRPSNHAPKSPVPDSRRIPEFEAAKHPSNLDLIYSQTPSNHRIESELRGDSGAGRSSVTVKQEEQLVTDVEDAPASESNTAGHSKVLRMQSADGLHTNTRVDTATRRPDVSFSALSEGRRQRAEGKAGQTGIRADSVRPTDKARTKPGANPSAKMASSQAIVPNNSVIRTGRFKKGSAADELTTWSRDQPNSSDDTAMPAPEAAPGEGLDRNVPREPRSDPATPAGSGMSTGDVPNGPAPDAQFTTPRPGLQTVNRDKVRCSVKAFLRGGKKPARRFTVEGGMSYPTLVQKMRKMFDLKSDFTIRYKDNEGDEVCVSSSNEVEEMFNIARKFSIFPIRLEVVSLAR